jgi:hypothetical protein
LDQQNRGETETYPLKHGFVRSLGKMMKRKIPIEGSPPIINDLAMWFILIFASVVIGGTLVRVVLSL